MKGTPPKLKKLHLFLRNCKVLKRYDLDNYVLYYLVCGKDQTVVECNYQNECVEIVRVSLR